MPATIVRRRGRLAHGLAYGGLAIFTVFLYLRPNELLPIGTFPIVKIVGLLALVAFFAEQGARGRFSAMPLEFKYLLGLLLLMVVGLPFSIDPSRAFDGITEEFVKVVLIFMLMINVVTTFERLQRLLTIMTMCAAIIALGSLRNFAAGEDVLDGRAVGLVGGMFGNPNDLALALNIVIPIAIGLALTHSAMPMRAVCWAATLCLVAGVVVTVSRAGVVTLAALAIFLAFRLRRLYRHAPVVLLLACVLVIVLAPGGFFLRVLTIFDPGGNLTAAESANQRWDLLFRSLEVAGFNPFRWIFGVGVNNFPIVSHRELVHHNSYLQVFNEVGIIAFVLYVLFLRAVLKSANQTVRETAMVRGLRARFILAVTLQTSLVAFAVGSFFASVAYLWYLYYPAACVICLRYLTRSDEAPALAPEVKPHVWHLRRT